MSADTATYLTVVYHAQYTIDTTAGRDTVHEIDTDLGAIEGRMNHAAKYRGEVDNVVVERYACKLTETLRWIPPTPGRITASATS